MASENSVLIIIDPNKGFIENVNYTPQLPGGHMNLCIPGAKETAENLATLIRKGKDYWYDIKVTKDSHHPIHIATPIWWKDKKGRCPSPFTTISLDEVKAGDWRAARIGLQSESIYYLEELEKRGRYKLVVWPPHCIIGTEGQLVEDEIRKALFEWELNFGIVGWKIKGDNPKREHYSGLEAEVPDKNDPSTELDLDFIKAVDNPKVDKVFLSGWALSHCFKFTVKSIVDNVADLTQFAKKLIILEDCTKSVPGFEQQGEEFLTEMRALNVTIAKSTEVL